MKRVILVFLSAVTASAAMAQRPSTLSASCREIRSMVKQSGAIVLSTGEHTYNRFVAHAGYCLPGEFLDYEYVQTVSGKCPLLVCLPESPYLFDD